VKTSDIFGKSGNGTLDAMVEKDPHRNSGSEESDEFIWLDVSLWTDEFDAIYTDALRSKNLPVAISETDDFDYELYEKNQNVFRKHFPEFEILGSFDDMYRDYIFGTKKIELILEECQKIKPVIESKTADRTLRKILYLCNKAIESGFYLTFRCD